MNKQFDELAKAMAQSVTRRSALKKFGVGLAGMAFAALGLGNAEAAPRIKEFTCCTYAMLNSRFSYKVCVPAGEICPDWGADLRYRLISVKEVVSCNNCK